MSSSFASVSDEIYSRLEINYTDAINKFSEKFPQGIDDTKALDFYNDISGQFNFESKNVIFIVVAHMVRTLPYLLYALAKIGAIAAVIPKGSNYPEDVEISFNEMYRTIIFRNINKTVLNTNLVSPMFCH